MSDTNQPKPSPKKNSKPYEKVYAIRVLPGRSPIDPELAASLEKVYETNARDPNRWHNNPAKKKAALEGLGKLLDEWEAENGAFTEEELAWAHKTLYGE
ncbi:MAG: hypothetical protein OXH95_08765 [bacterium]|nr:hypothetical protein [bacterium]